MLPHQTDPPVETSVIRVALWMRDGMLRDALECCINAKPDLAGRGFRNDPGELEAVRAFAPDIVLIEIRSGSCPMISVAERLGRKLPNARILAALSNPTPYVLARVLRAGMRGCLSKTDRLEEWLDGIRRAAAGHRVFSESIRARAGIDANGASETSFEHPALDLPPRQLEILRELSTGRSMREIGERLMLAKKTVEGHKSRLSRRLGISDRVELTRYAIREGIVEPMV